MVLTYVSIQFIKEIDTLQRRIPSDIFIRHYWSPKLKEQGTRILKALETQLFLFQHYFKQNSKALSDKITHNYQSWNN